MSYVLAILSLPAVIVGMAVVKVMLTTGRSRRRPPFIVPAPAPEPPVGKGAEMRDVLSKRFVKELGSHLGDVKQAALSYSCQARRCVYCGDLIGPPLACVRLSAAATRLYRKARDWRAIGFSAAWTPASHDLATAALLLGETTRIDVGRPNRDEEARQAWYRLAEAAVAWAAREARELRAGAPPKKPINPDHSDHSAERN